MKIYYAKISGLAEERIQKAMQFLPEERISRIEKSKQKKNQKQSLAAGVLLEYALRKEGIVGKTVTFQKNADGKPYIKEYPNLYYNLSHSNDYVALVVDEHPVGIDIEHLRIGYQKLVKRFFSEEEVEALTGNWSDELFTKLWTRKESYLKATGYGMRMPLDGFSVLDECVQTNQKMNTKMINPGVVYYLSSFEPEEDYWLSVCRKDEPVTKLDSVILQKVDLEKGIDSLCMMN
ncbi:MAG: 4'-phosphopantetheinyl transferase superfamily protein [Roseburia sp.]|nr:4'-phosphopantetheinyl transferase superfamily protein [Roseburia sp.]